MNDTTPSGGLNTDHDPASGTGHQARAVQRPAPELTQLEQQQQHGFAGRHTGLDAQSVQAMCAALGVEDLDSLIDRIVPEPIRLRRPLALDPPLQEHEVLCHLGSLAAKNRINVSMIGMGYYDTITPPVIQRAIFENTGWYTAYTPYQAEVSQGRLQALLTFQHMVSDLTGLPLANASLLDEATAAAEAMAMARRLSKVKGSTFFVERDCHPQTLSVLRTRARALNIQILVAKLSDLDATDGVFGALLSYPCSSGSVLDLEKPVQRLHERGAIVAVASDLLALTLLVPPGEWGADIVLGSAQRFGVPLGMGGPHAAFFACRQQYRRAMPGRIIGMSVDRAGRPALRMALQTREQHIRRDKATSNICTAQVLLAVIAAAYAMYHGPEGLLRIARRAHRYACIMQKGMENCGIRCTHNRYVDTLRLHVQGRAKPLQEAASARGYNIRIHDEDHISVSFDECSTRTHLADLLNIFTGQAHDLDALDHEVGSSISPQLQRKSPFLDHPIFNSYHTETEMMRYLRRLQTDDIALDRSMIPLGSCTMKLNAAAEMMPVTLPGFAKLHPMAPADQTQGYRCLFASLEAQLCEITGFDSVSLQPNAGSQGEFAGLLTIRAYQDYIGEGHRNLCLIPDSAHGTNPASAIMAGLEVITVPSDKAGNIDLEALRTLCLEHQRQISSLMVTFPSTHGIFDPAIVEVCSLIHDAGGQVYMDGANLNALVGLSRPGDIGADVSHINLHKTFCIPHGGGGPGMGPIGVKSHLTPFLPCHPFTGKANSQSLDAAVGAVSAAPWGSASILPISYAFIAMMSDLGLRHATKAAILNANYLAKRLEPHYPIVYRDAHGWVAHECIIDFRMIKEATQVTVEDVAKRLIDFGFHAPTMSWPVPDTMMIEPTESESKEEIDRFCDALIAIRHEIHDIEADRIALEDSPLHHAPHTTDLLMADWDRPYSRNQAYHPLGETGLRKYWPPVARIDNAFGDRNLATAWPEGPKATE